MYSNSIYTYIKYVYNGCMKLWHLFIRTINKLKDEFRKMLIDKDVTMSQVAERLDIIPQQLNNRFNNKRISLSDL